MNNTTKGVDRMNLIAIIILLPLVLFSVSAGIIMHTAPLLHSLIERHSRDPLNAHATLDYYYSYIASDTQELPTIEGMSDAELQHLRDVKNVWHGGLALTTRWTGLWTVLLARAWRRRKLASALEWGGLLTVTLMIASAIVPFNALWNTFHTITFPQGNWVFAYNAKIITLFPPEFFEAVVLRVALLTLFLGLVTYGISHLVRRAEKHPTTAHAQNV
ncbi:MAG: DUF1461 domain-containing protein [Nanoarchaeota archaeon]